VNSDDYERSATRSPSCAERLGAALRARDLGALGFGFRCGFLGLLHMEIVQERLEREYNLDLITTAPTVVYEVALSHGRRRGFDRQPGQAPAAERDRGDREPMVVANILVPPEYVGAMLQLCTKSAARRRR
jgi:GTP-binding protein LepA